MQRLADLVGADVPGVGVRPLPPPPSSGAPHRGVKSCGRFYPMTGLQASGHGTGRAGHMAALPWMSAVTAALAATPAVQELVQLKLGAQHFAVLVRRPEAAAAVHGIVDPDGGVCGLGRLKPGNLIFIRDWHHATVSLCIRDDYICLESP